MTLGHGRVEIVRDASLEARPGAVLALCGPNGSGKTTLLSALAGDLAPWQGRVTLGGSDLSALRPAALARGRAVLEQSPSLSADFDVATLAALGIPREVPPGAAREIVAAALAAVDLAERAGVSVARLSGGQRHRAHLARALAQLAAGRGLGAGHALLLDEPTASLDVAHQIGVMRAARGAAREGAAVVVVLHDLNLAAAFADRIALMAEGRIVTEGAPAEVLTEAGLSALYGTPLRVDRAGGVLRVTPDFAAGMADRGPPYATAP
ncbi:MAG: iron ABC transporter [Rhodovulum sulfidophilum]|uniref:Iron ABC transporter n=1 Tax=Rhodovulum sulfidophilum TaxID=35806 RepID=A0A2W5NDZ6_RHOSU|nr:MAG: iron ABC transporter [Rhodovulum sulfidophilum]